MNPTLRRALIGGVLALVLVYAAVAVVVWVRALDVLAHPPQRKADAALILGNRAFRHGQPNPCLTGRVDGGLALARAGFVRLLAMTGGVDKEDGRIEAEVMRQHALASGYSGAVLMEPQAASTRENLALSLAVLRDAGLRSVIIVSEPYHLWRVQRLARASGFDRAFDVQYAAAPTSCWRGWGIASFGAWREPLAVLGNGIHGYFH